MSKHAYKGLLITLMLVYTVAGVAPVSALSIGGSSASSLSSGAAASGWVPPSTPSTSSTGTARSAGSFTVSKKLVKATSSLIYRKVIAPSNIWQVSNPGSSWSVSGSGSTGSTGSGVTGSGSGSSSSGSTGAQSSGSNWKAPSSSSSGSKLITTPGTSWQKINPASSWSVSGSGSTSGSTGSGSTGSGSTGSKGSVVYPSNSYQKDNKYVGWSVSGSSTGSGVTGSGSGSSSSGYNGGQSSGSNWKAPSTPSSGASYIKYPQDSWQNNYSGSSWSTGSSSSGSGGSGSSSSSGSSSGNVVYPSDSWQKEYQGSTWNADDYDAPNSNQNPGESYCEGRYYPKDIDGHWAEIYIRRLYDLCVLEGYNDGSFKPEQYVTRAELTKMALYAHNIAPDQGCYDNDCGTPFTDLDSWQGPWIRPAWLKGIVKGYNNNLFRPNRNITRAEAVKVVLATFGYEPLSVSDSFFNDVSGWSTGWIEKAHQMGVVQGIGNGNFDPNRAVTRAEAAKIIVKTLEYWDTHIN